VTRVLRLVAVVSLVAILESMVASEASEVAGRDDHRRDLEVIDRALALSSPNDPWVVFGDVGIPYADLVGYRDRLAEAPPSELPFSVTPSGTTYKWPGGNVYYRFDPV